jgi:hypothetical protein
MATMLGHAAVSVVPSQQRPPSSSNLMATVTDPEVTNRARDMALEAMREAQAAAPAAGPAPTAKTVVFGAVANPVAAPNADATLFDGTPPSGIPRIPPSAAAPSEPKRAAAIGTMLGMPAVALPSKAPEPPVSKPAMKTMVGVAMPGIAPVHDRTPEPPPSAPAAGRQPLGTLLGVAAPGIAPLRAGEPERRPAPGPLAAPLPAPPPIVPAPAPLVQEPLPEAPQRPRKKGVPAVAVVAIVFGLVAVIGTVATFVIMRSGAPLTAQPQLDETGKESLKIRCESCPDGTVISLGASSSKVEAFATVLPLPVPLQIGENDLSMQIDRPAAGRDETVKVHVPVAYRVKADLSTLTVSPATVTVRVEATPQTEVSVDGKPVQLDASGKGFYTIDVSADVEGPSDEQKAIDRKIPFTIKPKGGAPENGQLVVRTGIAPLHIDAPGLELYTDRSTGNVAGQVKPGGTLTIDGQAVPVDAQGHFAIRVELPPDGEKVVAIVASAPPLAPRTVRSKMIRVPSLDAAQKMLEAKSPLGFDVYGADPKSKMFQLTVVDGEILEARVTQGHTILVIEEKKSCTAGPVACAVRVVHGEEVRGAARGDGVRAYGRVEGTAPLDGKTIPDIEGSLVITRPAKSGTPRSPRSK